MKKFTLFLLSMFFTLGTAVAQDNALKLESVNPTDTASVTSVEYIQLIFSKDVDVTFPEGGIVVTNEKTAETFKLTSRNEFAPKNYAILYFEKKANEKGDMEAEILTTPGKYSYTIPAGCIKSTDGEEFPEQTFSFTIANPFALLLSAPSSDVPVSKVDLIQLQFSKDIKVTLPKETIVISNNVNDEKFNVVNAMAYGPNAILYLQKVEELKEDEAPTTAITTPGTYTYTLPTGVVTSVDGEIFPEQTFTFTVAEPFEIVSVTPTETPKLEKIEITFNSPVAKVRTPLRLSIVDNFWTPVSAIKDEVTISDDKKTVTLELATPITTQGQYNLDLYNGIFTSESGVTNNYGSYTFKVIDSAPAFIVNYNEGDKVKEIGDLEITFQNVNEVKLVEDAEPVIAYMPGDGEATGTATLADKKITVKFDQKFTEEGIYTFAIPAGMFTMDGVANEEHSVSVELYTFEITPLEITRVIPVEGDVAQLDRIMVEFNQEVRLSFDENWQMISSNITLKSEDGKEYILTSNAASSVSNKIEYLVNAEWVNNDYKVTPITDKGKYTLDLSQIIVDHAAEQGIDEYGYPATIWHSKNQHCEGTVTWTITDTESGIEDVTGENGTKTIIDLAGRRVERLTDAGIYIVNGKKVLVK